MVIEDDTAMANAIKKQIEQRGSKLLSFVKIEAKEIGFSLMTHPPPSSWASFGTGGPSLDR